MSATAKVIEIVSNPDAYRAKQYGIEFVSKTVHRVTGKGVHNPSFNHSLEIWRNRDGRDPLGFETEEKSSWLLSPQATVISAHPGEPIAYGVELEIGDIVQVVLVSGSAELEIGHFEVVVPRAFHNPQLRRIEA